LTIATISIADRFQGLYRQDLQRECGDFLIRRSDGAYAYQLASVVDDAFQNVTDIVRGCDLLCSTPQQLYLQSLLGFSHPSYAHIPLLVASHGKRLSKRNHDASMDALRSVYTSPESILGHIAFIAGLVTKDKAYSLEELVSCAHLDTLCRSHRDSVAQLMFLAKDNYVACDDAHDIECSKFNIHG
jgi:glutamyl-tRNA synthetase